MPGALHAACDPAAGAGGTVARLSRLARAGRVVSVHVSRGCAALAEGWGINSNTGGCGLADGDYDDGGGGGDQNRSATHRGSEQGLHSLRLRLRDERGHSISSVARVLA
jgi:hypothetical protein